MARVAISILLVFLLVANSTAFALASSGSNVEDRIRAAIGFITGQYASGSAVTGFLHGASGPVETQRMYSFDNGIVALALSSYQQTHNSEEFYPYLKTAIEFLQRAQSSSGDFREYYDMPNNTWGLGEHLYYWDPYVLMGATYGPGEYAAINEFPAEKSYWAQIVSMLRPCVDYWIPRAQLSTGEVIFSFPNGSAQADVPANAAMLVALIHIALFEYFWGDMDLATKYARWSQSIAGWLYSLQEKDAASWGSGGFYTNTTRKLQLTFENGLAMFGLNSYFKAVGLFEKTLPDSRPSASELRQTMMNWTEGFVESTVDSWSGPQYGRSVAGVLSYPKETLGAASILQGLVDVWINIGSPEELCQSPKCYWAEAARVYNWMIGSNELSSDLQQAKDVHGGGGGFYAGIEKNGVIVDSDLATTALALFAMVRASYIQLPTLETTTRSSSQTTSISTRGTTLSIGQPEYVIWLGCALVAIAVVALVRRFSARSRAKAHRLGADRACAKLILYMVSLTV
jgi:hypothetical protein